MPAYTKTHSASHNQPPMSGEPVSSLPPNELSIEEYKRRREWNRDPIQDLFPRIPAKSLDRVLDLCIAKPFTYNLSQAKTWNARRLNSVVVAHVRHAHTDYDKLLRDEHVERFEARRRTGEQLWKVLREWCPWDESNDVLRRSYEVTLLRPEERNPGDAEWDPMDIDELSDCGEEDPGDPMELD
ncbi:hypothetical protein LTR56_007980 [Elasticomyces elasticus]|nr:hypothetical protein LTR22_020150 [Elasticomyces elasticus]KAK3647486.1 hypothetical protein LTR56_007980 [Elasticomyces elasticus]KAK4910690.1 hypothetical protein LTR49_020629 [Elasticomyces elasticus]KAK5735052.1 hypothetical protein LTS12_026550 [Elasticomyces elasticus]